MVDADVTRLIEDMERSLARLKLMVGVETTKAHDQERPPRDLISVSAAACQARCTKGAIRKWARLHPCETGGFGKKIGGRWWISQKPFRAFLRQKEQR